MGLATVWMDMSENSVIVVAQITSAQVICALPKSTMDNNVHRAPSASLVTVWRANSLVSASVAPLTRALGMESVRPSPWHLAALHQEHANVTVRSASDARAGLAIASAARARPLPSSDLSAFTVSVKPPAAVTDLA